MTKKGISLAICTYNGAKRIVKTLEHVISQNVYAGIDWELILVDNNSTDNTLEIVEKNWPKDQKDKLKIFVENKPGAVNARFCAIKNANFSIISFVDDDNWVSPNWINTIYSCFEKDKNMGIVIAKSEFAYSYDDFPDYFKTHERWFAIGGFGNEEGYIYTRPASFWTAGCSFNREFLLKCINSGAKLTLQGRTGKNSLGGEDHELCLFLNFLNIAIYYTDTCFFYHAIDKERIHKKYIAKLIYNGGKSRSLLNIYRNKLKGQKPSPYIQIFPIIFHFLVTFAKLLLKKIIGKDYYLSPNHLGFLLRKGTFVGYFQNFSKKKVAMNNIRLLSPKP